MSALAIGALVAALAAAPAGSGAGKAPDVEWKGQRWSLDELPKKFPDDAREVVVSWSSWAEEQEYRFLVDPDGLLVLVCPDGDGEAGRRLQLARDTAKAFDKHLPAPDRPEVVADLDKPRDDDDGEVIPEDPEGDEPLFGDVTVEREEEWSYEWGAGTRPLDSGAISVFVCRNEKEYRTLVDALSERRAYLAEWADEAKTILGFAIEDPLVGAFLLGADGLEEWDPHNELVHRVGHLLMLRRFGQQPYWVVKGWAWWSELAIRGSIYVFPYRDGFVGVGEHGGWDHILRNRFRDRDAIPTMDDVARLVRGTWDDFAAGMALGTVTSLVRERPDDFIQLLEKLREGWESGSRVDYADGTWERDRTFVLTPRLQLELFESTLGADVFVELRKWFLD